VSFRTNISRKALQAWQILSADFITIDEISMLTVWVANGVSMLLSRLLIMLEANSAENQLFSPMISDNYLSGNQLLDICLPSPHRTLPLSDFNSKIFSDKN
jgi:hypothetical protein